MSFTVPTVAPESAAEYTPVSTVGALLIDAMAPWMTLPLAWMLDSLGVMIDPVYTLVQDSGTDDGSTATIGTKDADGNLVTEGFEPGYSSLLDPSRCPLASLPYLGQFVGVTVPTGADETTARSLVSAEAGLNRGTPASIIAAAKRNLTGTQSVTLIERVAPDGSARGYWFQLIVRPEELVSESALVSSVDAVKPGGVNWVLVQQDNYTWAEATGEWQADSMTWAATASTKP